MPGKGLLGAKARMLRSIYCSIAAAPWLDIESYLPYER